MKSLHTIALVSSAALFALGCTSSDTETADDVNAPAFGENQGQEPLAPIADNPSHPGPYSNEIGGTIRNYSFVGYANYRDFGNDTTEIKLSHFYNPDGNGVFGPGSIHGEGVPKPQAIVLMMSAVWCPPCQLEAREVLPAEAPPYMPAVAFVAALTDGADPGTPVTYPELLSWASNYDVFYPLVMDGTEQITPIMEPAYPSNMIIDAKTMQIMYMAAGATSKDFQAGIDFWNALDGVLAGTYVPNGPGQQF